jgi:3-hydroxy-D-aspartate aldolase
MLMAANSSCPGLRAGDAAGHGVMELDGPGALEIGQKIRLVPDHCDPTVNLLKWFVCHRGNRVEALRPMTARGAFY